MTSATIASSGRMPCVSAARLLSGLDSSSTSAAASIDPAPMITAVSPIAGAPAAKAVTPTKTVTARKWL